MNYRLLKYKPPFFDISKQNNKACFNRYKHRLIAWYLLHEYSIDHALLHLAKYTDLLRVLNNEFKEYKQQVSELYQINLESNDKVYLKDTLINGCKICKNCGNRCVSNGDFCSVKCANQFKLKSPEHHQKISDSLKAYYSNKPDRSLCNNKKSETLKKFHTSLNGSDKEYLKIKGAPRTQANITEVNGFKIEGYKGHNSIVSAYCPTHGLVGKITYNTLKYNSKYLCEKCYINSLREKYLTNILKNCDDKNLKFIDFVDRYKIELTCKLHGSFTTRYINFILHQTGCPVCSTTKAELELQNIVKNGQFNTRAIIPPLELDVYSKENNMAIEYNGLMYHSYGKSVYSKFDNVIKENKNKHLIKTELCEKQGIQLFHIFENEWLNKSHIWKSIIKSKMGDTVRIFARKCIIREIDSVTASTFNKENHIQGHCPGSLQIGLFYNSELVQVMTFGKPRFNKKYEYELIRMCSKLNTTVVGGASKLLNYFERTYTPASIISYANRRWSMGNVYEKLGFTFSHNSEPNYFYFKPNKLELESRNKFQKHKLSKLLVDFNPKISESANMFNNGYRRIYDCGQKVYVKHY